MSKTATLSMIAPAALVAALVAAPAAAQTQGQQRPSLADPPAPEKRRLFDAVIGVFGDKAILDSTIRSELQAQIEGYKSAGKKLTAAEILRLQNNILLKIFEEEALAQGARTMRGTSREQVDQLVDHYVEEFRREEEERAGSVDQLTENLGILGQTWESAAEEKRREVMAELARSENLRRRYQDSYALAVTPAEMRVYYKANIHEFVQPAAADLEVVAILGIDSEAQAKAQQAAADWRARVRPAEEVAAEFGGLALEPRLGVRATPDDPNAPMLKQFAATAKEGDVSEPIARGNALWIVRATRVHAGRHDTFDDPKVQAYVQRRLVLARLAADGQKLIQQERDKLREIIPQARER